MTMKQFLTIVIFAAVIEYIGRLIYAPAALAYPVAVFYIAFIHDIHKWLVPITVSSLFFDLFSGMPFGVYTGYVLITVMVIYFLRWFVTIRRDTFILLALGIIAGRAFFSVLVSFVPDMTMGYRYWLEVSCVALLIGFLYYIIDIDHASRRIQGSTTGRW